tara:strand:- start:3069 stop:3650 length:582 start_codon:yes stop_codon:yes gene_type:complete
MQHVLTPQAKTVEPFAWWEGAFTEEQLDWLQARARESSNAAKVGGVGNGAVSEEIRRSNVSWLNNSTETRWLFEIIGHVTSSLNVDYFNFSLSGLGEQMQLTNYLESQQGAYGWHQDFGNGPSRKLSLVVQLSDPMDYEGGNLEVMTSGNPQTIKKQRGLIVAFPAWTLHRVTPVTTGSRQSLVIWASGEPFR